MPDHEKQVDRAVRPDPERLGSVPRVRPAGFFRALVVVAIAAAGPVAGCYESDPDDDAADSPVREDMVVYYGAPDGG